MRRSTLLVASHTLRHRSGRARERLGTVPGSLLDVSRPLLASPGRPKIALELARARAGRVPNASPRVPETALDPQNRPRAMFRRFFVGLAQFFLDFRPIFRRFSKEASGRYSSLSAVAVAPMSDRTLNGNQLAMHQNVSLQVSILALLCCLSLPTRLTKRKR